MRTVFLNCRLVLSITLFLIAADASAATIKVKQVDGLGVIATISPSFEDRGKPAKIWMGAILNGTLYIRGSGLQDWRKYEGGAFPVAQQVSTFPNSLDVQVTDFDPSALLGLELYVGLGQVESDLKGDHLANIYTVRTGRAVYMGSYVASWWGDEDVGSISFIVDTNGWISGLAGAWGSVTGNVSDNGSINLLVTRATVSWSFSGTLVYDSKTVKSKGSGKWSAYDTSDGWAASGDWWATPK